MLNKIEEFLQAKVDQLHREIDKKLEQVVAQLKEMIDKIDGEKG